MLGTLDCADVEAAVAAASLAPSVLNTQPWRFVARGDAIELHPDPERRLPVLDPDDRALTVSCGAALLNLRLAIAHLGREPVVELRPDPSRSVLAQVRAGAPCVPSAADERLHAMIPQRRTSRMPFLDQPVAPEVVAGLEHLAEQEGATLRILDAIEAYNVAQLVHEADREQRWDEDLRDEVRRWTRTAHDAVDGIPTAAFGPVASDPSTLARDFAFGLPVPGRGRAHFERHPTLAVLLTARDGPTEWLHAGQALERVWLAATAYGLGLSLLMQPLELPGLRWLVRPPAVGPTRPQALLRLGAVLAPSPPTPRRPVEDVLTFA